MKEEEKNENDNKILYNSFNQDYKCFVIGTKDGCRIYHSEPFKKGFKLGKKNLYKYTKKNYNLLFRFGR